MRKRKRSKTIEVKTGKKDLYFKVLSGINRGFYPQQIADAENISKQRISYYTRILKQNGNIRHVAAGVWELAEKGRENLKNRAAGKSFSIGTTEETTTSVHALQVEVPIVGGKLDLVGDFQGWLQEGFRNWSPQYKRVLSPVGYTIKNNNNKSVSLYLFSREIPRQMTVTPLVMAMVMHAYATLKEKGVVLDFLGARTTTLHLHVRNKDLDMVFNKGESFEVLLGRKCAKVLPNDAGRDARAWVDNTPYLGTETNDMQYKENLIMVPERVAMIFQLFPQLVDAVGVQQKALIQEALIPLKEQIVLHLAVQRETLQALQELREAIKGLKQ